MDMQPLEKPPEVSPTERRRKNQQIVSRGMKFIQKAASSSSKKQAGAAAAGVSAAAEEEQPPILMMSTSSMSGEGDVMSSVSAGEASSPSKRLLLINEERTKKKMNNQVNGNGRAKNKHSNKRSSKGGGMSSKITRALFRDRKSASQGNFSKMDSVASDAHGSHFKRSARSSFHAVEPRSSRSMDFGQVGSEPSFDNTSTHSGPVILEEPPPQPKQQKIPSVRITVRQESQPQRRRQQPPQQQHHQHLQTPPRHQHIMMETGNVSALSIGSHYSSAAGVLPHSKSLPPPQPSSSLLLRPQSMASSVSSLNYSESQGASSTEHGNRNNHSGLAGVRLTSTMMSAEDNDEPVPIPMSDLLEAPAGAGEEESSNNPLNTSISDLVQERVLMQERLLERLDQAATPKAAAATNTNNKFPPFNKQLPPKVPCTRRMESTSPDNGSVSSAYSAPLLTGTATSTTAAGEPTTDVANLSLKQHQERLLQGGDFLEESLASSSRSRSGNVRYKGVRHGSTADDDDLPLKLLHRLEAVKGDAQLMSDHHHQDPPLTMSSSVSFGSSTIATLRTTSLTSSCCLGRKTSNASSSQLSNPYAPLMMAEGLDLPEQRSRLSATAEPLLEAEDEEEEDDQEDPILVMRDDDNVVLGGHDDEESDGATTKSLCYLYSQDKEFENSILSPSTVTGGSGHAHSHHHSRGGHHHRHTTVSPLPAAAPKHMYRSDAIDAFLEQAQTNINNSCSKDHCVQVMEDAATRVLDGGIEDVEDNSGEVVVIVDDANVPSTNPNEATLHRGNHHCPQQHTGTSDKPPEAVVDTGIHHDPYNAADYEQGENDEDDHKSIVSDDFLNMMTSGCTGVPNHAAKEAMREKLVALEAGWSGFRNQFHERIQSLEESWQGWNLNSLLAFNSPSKEKAASTAETAPSRTMSTEAVTTTNSKELPSWRDAAAAMTPTTMGSTTVLTTPSTMSTVKMPNQQMMMVSSSSGQKLQVPNHMMTPMTMFPEDPLEELELISQADDSVVGVMKSPMSMDATEEEVVLGVVRELEKTRIRSSPEKSTSRDTSGRVADPAADDDDEEDANKNKNNKEARFAAADAEDDDDKHTGIEKIGIGTTERDVPLSLKHTLADISIIAEGPAGGHTNLSGNSSSSRPVHGQRPGGGGALDSSRDDSEGGKVVLDAAEWDPVDSSGEADEEEEEVLPESSVHAVNEKAPRSRRNSGKSGNKPGGFVFFKRKNRGKKKAQSPKSVLLEI